MGLVCTVEKLSCKWCLAPLSTMSGCVPAAMVCTVQVCSVWKAHLSQENVVGRGREMSDAVFK